MIDSYTKRQRPLRDFDIKYSIEYDKCQKCADKPCLESCPIDAIYVDDNDGLVKLHTACFGCVLCRKACPYDAIHIELNMASPIRENVPNINTKLCVGCGACVQACKTGSIHLKVDKYGHPFSEIDKDECVRCGYCSRVCPTDAIKYGELIPKSVKGGKAIVVKQENCIGCMTCTRVCPSVGAITVGTNKLPYINPAYCARCEECMHSCPSGAIKYSSRKRAYAEYSKLKSSDIVHEIVNKDINILSLNLISLNRALWSVAKSLTLEFDDYNDFENKEIKVNDLMLEELGLLLDSSIIVDKFNKLFTNYLMNRQIKVIDKNCIACGECLNVCPTKAIDLNPPSPIEINDNCVCCGQCIEMCKFDAIYGYDDYFYSLDEGLYYARNFLEGKREGTLDLSSKKCQVCGICSKNCPTDALILEDDKIVFDSEKCIYCRQCQAICPVDAIKTNVR